MTDGRTLSIYFTADVHDRRGFGPQLARVVEPGALLVDCGDSLAGSSTVYRRREPIAADFAAAPYRAQAVGNREFHYLYGCMRARAQAMPVPWVCSNLLDLRGRDPVFARSMLLESGGKRVRLFALLVPQYRTGSGWERIFGWRFLAPDVALRDLLASTPGADVTVVLSHLGLSADRAIAESFPMLDAIVGGHSHDLLREPVYVGDVPIVHAGAFAAYAGRLELDLSARRSRVASYRLVPLLDGARVA